MTSAKHPVQRKYDRAARAYDRRWSGYVRLTLDHLAETLALRGDEKVLDVPCGTGELIVRLLAQHPGLEITGMDLSEEMLAVAREKVADDSHVELQQGRAEHLQIRDNTFDLVASASSFHYFDPPQQALQEFRRVLKPGGQLVIMDWDRTHLLWRSLDPVFRWLDPAYTRCYTPSAVDAMLRKEGFRDVSIGSVRLGTIWGLWTAHAVAPK